MKKLIPFIAIALLIILSGSLTAQNGGMNIGTLNVSTTVEVGTSLEVGTSSESIILMNEMISLPPLTNSDILNFEQVPYGSIVFSSESDVLLVFDGDWWKRVDGKNDHYLSTCEKNYHYQGQDFRGVLIGTQCWMDRNVNIGTRIHYAVDQTNNSVIEKYCYSGSETYCDTYGGLYQWDEAMGYSNSGSGVQGICPDGWHIPTDAEWTTLIDYLGGSSVAGGKMKETGFIHWDIPNTSATNASKFTALPGGYRTSNGYTNRGIKNSLWSATENDGSSAYYRYLYYTHANVVRVDNDKSYGYSVRCLRNN